VAPEEEPRQEGQRDEHPQPGVMVMVTGERRDGDGQEQERDPRHHPQRSQLRTSAQRPGLGVAGEVADELAQLADRLGLVGAVEPLLKLGDVDPALGVVLAQPVGSEAAAWSYS
jgi:hypothetical protein